MSVASPLTPLATSFANPLPSPSKPKATTTTTPARNLRNRAHAPKVSHLARLRSPYARPRTPTKKASSSSSSSSSNNNNDGSASASASASSSTRKAILAATAAAAGGFGVVGARSGSLVRVPSAAAGPSGSGSAKRGHKKVTSRDYAAQGGSGKENSRVQREQRQQAAQEQQQPQQQMVWVQGPNGERFQVPASYMPAAPPPATNKLASIPEGYSLQPVTLELVGGPHKQVHHHHHHPAQAFPGTIVNPAYPGALPSRVPILVPAPVPAPQQQHQQQQLQPAKTASNSGGSVEEEPVEQLYVDDGVYQAYIPLKLPRPRIPRVDVMNLADDMLVDIPLAYIIRSLRIISPTLFAAAALYRPSPIHNSGPDEQARATLPNKMQFILDQEALACLQKKPEQGGLLGTGVEKGREPTHVLAVRGIPGREMGGDEKGRLILIHHIVYATQCAHFPRLGDPVDLSCSTSSAGTVVSVASTSSMATTIAEGYGRQQSGDSEDGITLNDRPASENGDDEAVDADMEQEVDDKHLPMAVDLPLIHIAVPYPSNMPLLHTWLYTPNPHNLLAFILDLPLADRHLRIPQRLLKLSTIELLRRLKTIHAMWNNAVCLGISDLDLWKVMVAGWKVIIEAIKKKGEDREGSEMDIEM